MTYARRAIVLLSLAGSSCVTVANSGSLEPQDPEIAIAAQRELDRLPYIAVDDVQQLSDWLRVSADSQSIFLNLAFFSNRFRGHEHVCRDHGPLVMRGNFRVRFDGPGRRVYCNPMNNWALLDVGRHLNRHDTHVVMCVNVTDRHGHWSQHGAEYAYGIEDVGGLAADGESLNFLFVHVGARRVRLVSEAGALREGYSIRPC